MDNKTYIAKENSWFKKGTHLYDVVKEELHKILTVKEWVRRKKRDDKKKAIDEFIKKEYGYEEKN